MYDPNAIKIYTDGSANPNPGRGGIGMVVEFPENLNLENLEFSDGYILSNNNRMEIKACIKALEWLQTQRFTRALIITDSEYIYSNHKNISFWKKDNWRSSSGKPYENPDLLDTFIKDWSKVKFPVELRCEKGKTREILKRVDALAKQGAAHPTKTDYGFQSGKFTAPRTVGGKVATLYIPNGKEKLIRVYKKSIYGKNENELYKITFDIYDETEGKYMEKCVAYKGKDCITLERNNCYKVAFNNDPKFPLIIEATKIEYLKNKALKIK